MGKAQKCPVCGGAVPPVPRYPRYVCRDCVPKARGRDGRSVAFGNDHPLGYGCVGFYTDTNQPYPSSECWIDGVRCIAGEARFGGIVIEAMKELEPGD